MKREESELSALEDPPQEFCEWWHPHQRDQQSGADVGGHTDAERVWARKDPGRWVHRKYGTSARSAWNAQRYRDEYLTWVQLGRPEREDFISLAAPLEDQQGFLKQVKSILRNIGKKMPEPGPFDHDSKAFQPY
jgi:hypothetical protein